MSNLRWRLAGVLLLGVCVLQYQPGGGGIADRMLLPLGMALAAGLMVQNVTAVAMGIALLAGIHSDLDSADPFRRIVYPLLALIAGAVLSGIFLTRFRARIRETHEVRWQRRRPASTDDSGPPSTEPPTR